jgi:hypothetical protein
VPSQAGHRCSLGFATRVFIPTPSRPSWLARLPEDGNPVTFLLLNYYLSGTVHKRYSYSYHRSALGNYR